MNVRIYKDSSYEVFVDFYRKPALVLLVSGNRTLLTVDLNMKYISGDREKYKLFMRWLNKVSSKLDDIIWEWETGNDNFPLIEDKLVV
ncbi:MAG: hypothetical protein K6E75_03125 [Lachnospiraceae bacterium]|nr:hypothetical protein [Lachnospiraceae bacterium]